MNYFCYLQSHTEKVQDTWGNQQDKHYTHGRLEQMCAPEQQHKNSAWKNKNENKKQKSKIWQENPILHQTLPLL